jgi:cell division septum initiation protein DivIVA
MKALIPPKELEKLTIALVVESPERKKKGKRFLDLSPKEKAEVLKEEQDLKALCEKLDGKIFQIQIIQDSSSRRVAAISFQKPNR